MTKYVSINNKPTIEIDSSTPITTTVSGDITIDSSTAVSTDANITNTNLDVTVQGTADVNVTNATLATNATIQNATLDVNLTDLNGSLQLPVSVDNQPTVTVGNSNLDVTLQNSSINTNATIQNSSLNTYNYVYDGSTWRFQLSDSSGKAIGLDHTYYTSSEITALGSSTDINLWLAAYNDSMLQNKWVASYNDEFEETVYYQHPSLGNGTKCLRLVYQYSTQNTQTVVESIVAAVADWSYSDDILGSVSVSVTNQVDPSPNNAIPVHTKVADLAFTVDTVGTATISLSGTNASLYHIYDTTTSTGFSSGTFSSSGVYELHVASDFSGSSYSHSINVDIVGDLLGATDSATLSISGTYSGVTGFANEKYFKGSTDTGAAEAVRDLVLVGTNKNPFVYGSNDMPSMGDGFSMSFWLQVPSYAGNFDSIIGFSGSDTRNHVKIFHLNGRLTFSIAATGTGADYSFAHTTYNTWQHVIITKKAVAPRSPNYDNTDYFCQIYINGSPQNPTVTYWDNNPVFSTTRWDTLTISEVFISGPGRNYNTNNAWASSKSGRQWKVDQLGFYNKELSQSDVNTIYNGGVTKDLMDLPSTFNLGSYFKFGDHNQDVTTAGSIKCYDEVNDIVYFEDNNGTIEDHGTSDTPYVGPSAAGWGNGEYVDAPYTGASSSNTYQYGRYYNLSTDGLWPSLENQLNYRDVTNGHTLSLWVKRPTSVSGLASIWSENFNAGSSANQVYFGFYWNGTQDLYLYQARNNNRIYKVLYVGNSVSVGDWFHFAISVPANETHMVKGDVYINGSLAQGSGFLGDTSTNLVDTNTQYTKAVNIACTLPDRGASYGTYSGSNAASGDLEIDELTTWSKALTQTQIQNLKDSNGAPIDPTTHSESASLERYFRFGDGANDGPHIFDEQDSTYQLTAANNVDYTTALTSSDSIYVPASGSFANTYYVQESVSQSMQSLTSDIQLKSNTKFCVSFWMKSSEWSTTYSYQMRIFGNQDYYLSGGSSSDGFQLRKSASSTNWQAYFMNGVQASNFQLIDLTVSNPSSYNNNWTHILINYDYDSVANSGAISPTIFRDSIDVYINGTALTKTVNSSYTGTTHSTVLKSHGINQGYWGNGSTISGMVNSYDELAYWDGTALTSQEIGLVYNSGNKVIDLQNTSGLTAPDHWWRHEDSSNLTHDTIGNANSGTLSNATQTAY